MRTLLGDLVLMLHHGGWQLREWSSNGRAGYSSGCGSSAHVQIERVRRGVSKQSLAKAESIIFKAHVHVQYRITRIFC